jgi:hypothetical protein
LNESDFLKVKGGNGFNIYVNDNYIVYNNDTYSRFNISLPFYLHVIPAYPKAINLNDLGFLTFDFDFRTFGFRIENTCAAVRDMPKKKIKTIRTGQWISGQGFQIWETEFELNGAKHKL